MDDPSLPKADHDAALDGLARLNAWSFADRTFRKPILALNSRREDQSEPLVILDLATGSGDLVVRLGRWLRTRGIPVHWKAVDISEHALERCRDRSRACGLEIETHRLDAIREPLPSADIALCSLFLHHLEFAEVTTVLTRLDECAKYGGIVSDLRRSTTGLFLASFAGRLATRSPVVHFDAPTSVRAALTTSELDHLATDARLPGKNVERIFPQRQRLTWQTGEPTP